MNSEIAFKSAVDLTAALRNRQIGARELLDFYLERVQRFNPRLNAIVQVDEERARARADEADRALAGGEVWGPLHGLPITIKEIFETEGFRWTAGDSEFTGRIATRNAPAVARLIEAGANVFGVTNSPWNGKDVQTFNDIYGTTNNPWDLERSPGGSSGGAAAALSAGLCGLELGSDIGGSIRNPAHYCGIYGHKPTFGIVPRRPLSAQGPLALKDLVVSGPMARSAADLALELSVLATPEADQAIGWRVELPEPRHKALSEYRVAAWLDDSAYPVDKTVLQTLEQAVNRLRASGVAVDDAARPDIGGFFEAGRIYDSLLAATTAREISVDRFIEMTLEAEGSPAQTAAEWPSELHNGALRHRTWQLLEEQRQQIRVKWAEFFQSFDVLLMPVTPVTALQHDHSPRLDRTIQVNGVSRSYFDQLAWVGQATMAYLPSTVAPIGLAANGLPVGVQIVGPYLEDYTTIDFAGRLADVIGGYQPPPGYD